MPLIQAHPNVDAQAQQQRLRKVMKLQVPVIVKLAERKILLSEVMRLGVGAIIEFVKSSSEPLDLLVSNKPVGQGETVKVGENFGVKITRIGDAKQILQAVTGR